jgi:hypothetical protein
MDHKDEKYLVASNGESPNQIYFTWEDAEKSGAAYLDAFDENGKLVKSYMLVDGSYTTDF